MPERKKPLEPRPEARPLAFKELTAEQRSAGDLATRLLRGMAERDGELPKPPEGHAYVPLIDETRSNRVILLDGARGSGKSALLVTLVDAYVRALTGQGVPQGYEVWLLPDDRIVPVGLIDLQPLPRSSHLMLYLVTSLQKVVKSIEENRGTAGTGSAAWQPGSQHELLSRTRWREFARAAAMGWNDMSAADKHPLDPDSFTIELEEEEMLRLDVVTTFRRFIDALASDYAKWKKWQQKPLFLLAIDDADMNTRLSRSLLDLLRTLWHPRLAFLLTGDTAMFLDLGREHEADSVAQDDQDHNNDYHNNDITAIRKLRADIYAKIIPQKHRCKLRSLAPEQRLSVGPCLGKNFFQVNLAPDTKTTKSAKQKKLEDLFKASPQTLEALPDRLRHLHELAAFLQQSEEDDGKLMAAQKSARLIERTWTWVMDNLAEPDDAEYFRRKIQIDDSGNLRVDFSTALRPVTANAQVVRIDNKMTLVLDYPERFQHPDPDPDQLTTSGEDMLRPVVAAMMLANDYTAAVGQGFAEHSLVPSGLETLMFAHVAYRSYSKLYRIPWPAPTWSSFEDLVRLAQKWKDALMTLKSSTIDIKAYAFVKTILSVGTSKEKDKTLRIKHPEEKDWSALAQEIAAAANLPGSTQRQLALSDWSIECAALLTAPESGLSAEAANSFLGALQTALDKKWPEARERLNETREKRIRTSERGNRLMPPSKSTVQAKRSLIESIDGAYASYRFSSVVSRPRKKISSQTPP